MLKSFIFGPSVLMLVLMLKDVATFLVLSLFLTFSFALALFFMDELSLPPTEVPMDASDCAFTRGDFSSYVAPPPATPCAFLVLRPHPPRPFRSFHGRYGVPLLESLLGFDGVMKQIECYKEENMLLSTLILDLYLCISAILLLNMLIAMMAETFSMVRQAQEEEYAYLSSQIVVLSDICASEIPPPLSVLRTPAALVRLALKAFKWGTTNQSNSAYEEVDAAQPEQWASPEVQVLVKALDEEDQKSDVDNVPNMVRDLHRDMRTLHGKTVRDEFAEVADTKVNVYEGFKEEASRLVFHYGANFGHLKEPPMNRTYLPSGVMENQAKTYPTTVEHELEEAKPPIDEKTRKDAEDKLVTRGCVTYPYVQSMPDADAKRIITECGQVFVHERDNGTYGLSQIWGIKVNKSFEEGFTRTTYNPNQFGGGNPDPKIFQLQAVFEFQRTIKLLFGPDALSRGKLIFAQNSKTNTKRAYVGTVASLEAFLRRHPEVVDELMIAKLYPGGFVSIIKAGKKYSTVDFDWPVGNKGCSYVLYTKQGYESMVCIKSLEQFNSECELGTLINTEDTAKAEKGEGQGKIVELSS